MKKSFSFVKLLSVLMFACVICGAFVFTACSSGSQEQTSEAVSAEAAAPEVTQADIEKYITGKWMMADRDGEPVLTNEKVIYTFGSTDKAFMSASLNFKPEIGQIWAKALEADVEINGNKMVLTYHAQTNKTSVHEYTITAINDREFTADHVGNVTVDGKDINAFEEINRYVKVDDDLSDMILGTWEGHCTSENSEFDDGQDHRWEFKADGDYVYYEKDGENWVPGDDTMNEYFVDGHLLCSRWADKGTEKREWWEISIDGDTMSWTGLREGDDGETYTATFEMKKVESQV